MNNATTTFAVLNDLTDTRATVVLVSDDGDDIWAELDADEQAVLVIADGHRVGARVWYDRDDIIADPSAAVQPTEVAR